MARLGLNRRQGDSIHPIWQKPLRGVKYSQIYKYAVNLAWNYTVQYFKLFAITYYNFVHITMVDNPNPGNFHNRPHEEVEQIARKGGQSSHHSGFASMDTNKQVSKSSFYIYFDKANSHFFSLKREIASKGGHASRGKFEPGSPRAKEAGRKGGRSAHQQPEEQGDHFIIFAVADKLLALATMYLAVW